LYNQFIGQNNLYLGYQIAYKDIDRGLIEVLGPSGIINLSNEIQNTVKSYQTGNIFHYLFLFFFSIVIILFVLIFLNENIFRSIFISICILSTYIFFSKYKANIT